MMADNDVDTMHEANHNMAGWSRSAASTDISVNRALDPQVASREETCGLICGDY